MDEKVIDRIRGTILGSASANSLGGACIGLNHKEIVAAFGMAGIRDFQDGLPRSNRPEHRAGLIPADTLMAITVAESIIGNQGQFDPVSLRAKLTGLLEDAEFLASGPGAPCLAGLRRAADGHEPIADGSAESTHDSGAARAYPLGCLPDRYPRCDIAAGQARLTQGDSRVWAAAAILSDSISGFVRGDRLDTADQVREYVNRQFEIADKIDPRFAESWDDVAPDLDYTQPATDLPYSLLNVESNVNEAVPTAVGIFLIFRHSFEEAACAAASAGGDTDTVSAIVGALSGAYHGLSAIPRRWTDKLASRQRLDAVVEGLIGLW